MDADRLATIQGWAHRADVVEVDDGEGPQVAGFVIVFDGGSAYDAENYAWFTERYGEELHYLDRIVFAPRFRRRGLGGFVYDVVERDAAARGRLTLEVNARPANEPSLAFHAKRGFVEVGQRTYTDGTLVSMMAKEL
nr:GNAT family N-acetyltransferase [Nocardioides sp. zg-DK7169]